MTGLALRGYLAYAFAIMADSNTEFSNVSVLAKANLYFDGKVVSHSVMLEDGSKKTLGLIFPGEFYFGTEAPERMEIISGSCVVKVVGSEEKATYTEGTHFDVPGNSGFHIAVSEGTCEYICSFLA